MTPSENRSGQPLIGVVGVTYTGNMGGQVMLHAVRQQILKVYPSAQIRLFSIYPEEDAKASSTPGLEIVPARPARLVLFELPLSIFLLMLALLAGPGVARRLASSHIRRLMECDIVIDLSGIAFVANRGMPLLAYNLACVVPSFVAGVPHFKLAQSLGPFGAAWLRSISRWVFGRCSAVVPRGRQSALHLQTLGISVEPLPDVSFALTLEPKDLAQAKALVPHRLAGSRLAVVSPSRVTRRSCEEFGADYIGCLRSACNELTRSGFAVLLVAHSVKEGNSKNNDLFEIDELVSSLGGDERVVVVPFVENARVLRALFSLADIALTSRFHATVAALAGAVPLVTIGWNY